MGIRTKGFTKVSSQKSGDVEEEEKGDSLTANTTQESGENIGEQVTDGKRQREKKVSLEKSAEAPAKSKAVVRRENIARSPLKLRTPVTMARLGAMKVTARKLKKHRNKKSLFVQSANKILRSSIKSNKTRRAARLEEKAKTRTNGTPVPSRVSTRTLVRRSSRAEGIPDAPLRTVELIKRPLELREPATKLLYMASLGLYPRTGESDMTPIVVIRELNCSPGKKNGVRKSLELPLIPYHKRFLDLANSDKQSLSENIKPNGGKQVKRDSRRSPPANSNQVEEVKKPVSGRKTPVNITSTVTATEVSKPAQMTNSVESTKPNVQQQKKKTPPPRSSGGQISAINFPVVSKLASSLDLTVTPTPPPNASKLVSFTQTSKTSPNSNSKSLLRNNISPPIKQAKDNLSLAAALNLSTSILTKAEPPKPITTESLLASTCSVTQAMNLLMSNITILPSNISASRKRPMGDSLDMKIDEIANKKNLSILNNNAIGERKPPRKKAKANNEQNAQFSLAAALAAMPISVSAINSGNNFLQSQQSQNTDDQALNLCMKKVSSEPLNTPVLQHPPKLQLNSNVNVQKDRPNGAKPLNLIIPRPPPLLKAPLDVTNFANCTQIVQPALPPKTKAQPKKARKSRPNNNQQNQSNLQSQQMLALPIMPALSLSSLPILTSKDATVHAKSLLKCMNGEENSCVREIGVGESLDSVKTMLSRLQTRIGPAVNGVRLITIE